MFFFLIYYVKLYEKREKENSNVKEIDKIEISNLS